MLEHKTYNIFCFLLLSNMLLVSCSTYMPSYSDKNQILVAWQSHQQHISMLTRYQMYGTFIYLSQKKKIYARFNWQQINIDRFRLFLINPLSNVEIDVNFQTDTAKFVNSQGKFFYINSFSKFLDQKLDMINIPVKDLRQWIIGLPGNATDFTLNSRGYLNLVKYNYNEQHWTLIYQKYYNNILPALPAQLELIQGDNRIRLKIDHWSLQ